MVVIPQRVPSPPPQGLCGTARTTAMGTCEWVCMEVMEQWSVSEQGTLCLNPPTEFVGSWNPRMGQARMDYSGSSGPTSLLKQGHPTAHGRGLCPDGSGIPPVRDPWLQSAVCLCSALVASSGFNTVVSKGAGGGHLPPIKHFRGVRLVRELGCFPLFTCLA